MLVVLMYGPLCHNVAWAVSMSLLGGFGIDLDGLGTHKREV